MIKYMNDLFGKIKLLFKKVTSHISISKIRKYLFGHKASGGVIGKLVIYVLLIGISYVFLFPIIRMILLSFMTRKDLLSPEVSWIPTGLTFSNFVVSNHVLQLLPPSWFAPGLSFIDRFLGTFTNPGNLIKSLFNMTTLALIQTVIAAFTGFAFARYNFKFKKFFFVMLLVSFIIPLPMVTVPRIMIISGIQENIWIPIYDALFANNFLGSFFSRALFSTLIPQVLFSFFGQGINSAILILIFYNFFKMIPITLDEAARIDGASSFQVFWHIYVKLVVPIILIVFLFSFIWNWNDIYTATIYYQSGNPLVVMRLSLFDSIFADQANSAPGDVGIGLINEGYKSAATFLSILPLFIIYIVAQKQFIAGIERTGMTGE
ncbi:carbohydrate ABC transporter permease [Acholeplasma laidlawii]|uniref:ABC-type transport system, permease component n=3 Tax=Acholeplasma laidlawii TaxID=2148 RepID=A9NG54_ACHLI|nr:carbohydrate ABC transporter permease [Acholeplasma laidlawii]ABX81334.1 ABC-type transport system, permease component [Acholeplasma laidlawii PG-8A]NWH10086.1 carbohydrate ABC transporter permease [Acholeplasma laidlawii]NWH11476.1 carbohydrate ABC transporter permease [Acholeplasma laidlawii]NWH13114.1 carbohydrate ABC transporter permease [Acholeplasma laidlawii]NWH14618.1 carbohydrate ABC transporter permease [Acholeplasma laidlawii]